MSLLTPIHFRVPGLIFGPLVAKYLAENGVSGTFWKNYSPIHFKPGIYRYRVSLLTPIHFGVPSLICGPLVAENGVSGTFWKSYWLNSFHTWHISLWGESLDSYTFRVPSLIFGPMVAKYLAENGVSGTFLKSYWLNSFHTWHLSLWGESLDPYTFSCSYPYFQPSGGQIFGWKWGIRKFLKKLLVPFITYLAFNLRGWVSWPLFIFVFLASFSAPWWPNIWLKVGFPELFEKAIGSIHFIPGIYPYGVSLLTPIHFHAPSLIFGPMVTKYLVENRVSWTLKKKLLVSWRIPTCVAHDCKIQIFIEYFWMRWVAIRAGVYCPHLWAQLVANFIFHHNMWCAYILCKF